MYEQLVTPNPNVSCTPGWCLNYVQRAFNAPWSGVSATAAYESAKAAGTLNTGLVPSGIYVPIYFAFAGVPEGHIVVGAPDGSVWSSSHPTSNKPVHHPSLAALYQYYGGTLSYRGWSTTLGGMQIVKQYNVEETMTPYALNLLSQIAWNKAVNGDDKFVKSYTGKPVEKTLEDVLGSKANIDQRTKSANFDSQINAVKQQLATLQSQTAKPNATNLSELKATVSKLSEQINKL